MKKALSWCIKITKAGEPVIMFAEDNRFRTVKMLKPLSDDIVVKNTGLYFSCRSKDVDSVEYCCPFDKVSFDKIPTPIEKLEAYPLVIRAKPHILYFLYELVTGVVIQKHSPFKNKPEFDVFDVIDLLNKYKIQLNRVKGVDFDTIVSLIP